MKKYFYTGLMALAIASTGFLQSCGDDDETFDNPSITLSQTTATASSGDEVEVTVTTLTDGGFKNLVVTKLWDGAAQDTETFTSALTAPYVYTVVDEDADHVLTLNFTVTDNQNKTASTELVIEVELTARQLLLKYNWRLDQEIRKKTNTNDISDVYNDDIYRFNADGTYNKSIGAKVDDFSDIWFNYCYYDLNDNTLKLLMSRTGAFGEKVTDTLRITIIDDTKLYADITYYDLDQLDDKYDPVEEFQKRLVAVAKTNSFDPYQAGDEDDDTGPAGYCEEVVFEND